jgi:Flp pilus assembly pilin Flp
MVEYALLAGFVAVGSGILLPVGVVGSIGQIWSKVRDLLERYASQPG